MSFKPGSTNTQLQKKTLTKTWQVQLLERALILLLASLFFSTIDIYKKDHELIQTINDEVRMQEEEPCILQDSMEIYYDDL